MSTIAVVSIEALRSMFEADIIRVVDVIMTIAVVIMTISMMIIMVISIIIA